VTRNPHRKRQVRLVVSLTAALLLAGALMYTSFGAAHDEMSAGHLLAVAKTGRSYQLAGTVVAYHRDGRVLTFRVRDPKRANVVAQVRYTGAVPDPVRVGRGVIVTVHKQGRQFIGEGDSLVTKCPSKFQAAPPGT
jgi:cytochrome c-type biogenesis protein CcmE